MISASVITVLNTMVLNIMVLNTIMLNITVISPNPTYRTCIKFHGLSFCILIGKKIREVLIFVAIAAR